MTTASHALRLIGMMLEAVHTKGYTCGSERGNASGNWEMMCGNETAK